MDAPSTRTSNKFCPEETILIFDWDDTVLPSTWLRSQGLLGDALRELAAEEPRPSQSLVTEAQREKLSEVARAARETLAAANQHGQVVLITNAKRGWIELSCSKFMPTLLPVLESVKLVSARTAYERVVLNSPFEWKLFAFEAEIMRITKDRRRARNVVSVGDGIYEREALLRIASKSMALLPHCRWKSVKFLERPTVSLICEQHALVTKFFREIVEHDGNLDW